MMSRPSPLIASVWFVVSLLLVAGVAVADPSSPRHCADEPFVPNVYWTTDYGPAGADVLDGPTNMVPCTGKYALCYYSGAEPLPCVLAEDGETASCRCYALETSGDDVFYVDINSILNTCVYVETVRDCGHDGSGCQEPNSAPVCDYIQDGTFAPGAELVSTYSTAKAADHGGATACTECGEALYAGCMTASCTLTTGANGQSFADCRCPVWTGPFQVGQEEVSCALDGSQVWSAAYNPKGCPPKAPKDQS